MWSLSRKVLSNVSFPSYIFQALTSESEANLTEDQKKMTNNVTLLLAFLNILSKHPSNLEFLNSSRILSHVLQILKLVSLKLNSIMSHLHPHELLASVNHNDAFQIWWDNLKVILGYCIQILANFCGDCTSNLKVAIDFKVALVKLGLPRIFKGLLTSCFSLTIQIFSNCFMTLEITVKHLAVFKVPYRKKQFK